MAPGQTVLTRMRSGPSSVAKTRLMWMTLALAAE